MPDLLFLGQADIDALGIDPPAVYAATAALLKQKAAGRAHTRPKLAVPGAPGRIAQAMVAVSAEPPLSLVKWVGVNDANPAAGLPLVHATVILSDAATGRPRTIMSAGWLTGVRTAACSAIGAAHLARLEAETVAFVGCGLQAHTHLAALLPVLPNLRRARLLGRSRPPADRLARAAEAAGLRAEIVADPESALSGAGVVVSTVPAAPDLRPFLDARHLAPGAFVAAVDGGRPWRPAPFASAIDLLATDDRAQSEQLVRDGKMTDAGPFGPELGELLAGTAPGRTNPAQRTALVFAGTALADLGLAALIDRMARERGVGTPLRA